MFPNNTDFFLEIVVLLRNPYYQKITCIRAQQQLICVVINVISTVDVPDYSLGQSTTTSTVVSTHVNGDFGPLSYDIRMRL